MKWLRLIVRQIAYENKAFWRNPPAAFFTFVFPLMFLVLFNLLFGNETRGVAGREVTQSTFYVPAIAAFSIISACYTNVAIGLSLSRDLGILKRIRGMPLPSAAYLSARIVHATVIGFLLVVIVTAAGTAFYGVDVPGHTMPAMLVTLVVGAAAFCSLGIAITAFVPNADAAPAVVNATILPLLFISDIFIPLDDAPSWLLRVSDVFPIRHFSAAMQAAFNPFETGTGFRGWDLLIIAAWGAAGLGIALRRFSWEPRR